MAPPGIGRRLVSGLLAVALGLGQVAPAAAAAAPAPAAAPAWEPNEDDLLLLEVRLGRYRLAEDLRGYATPEGACINLGDALRALDVPVAIDEAAGTAAGWAFAEKNRLRIDRKAGLVETAAGAAPLGPHALRDTPEGWCADADALGVWLGIALDPDLNNAILIVRSETKLPVEAAEERKARAARVRPARASADAMPSLQLPYEDFRMPSLDAVVTVGGVSDAHRGDRFDRRYELYASGEVARVSVDARLASDSKGVPESLRMRAYRTDPEGKLPLGATHIAAGDVAGFASPLVGQSVPGRGAVITNRPVDRPDSFDRTTLRGELPSGWDAELYRNGELLGVAQNRADGRYEFVDVALLYGRNRLEVVLYGPQGQVRRRTETVSVGQESIATGKTFFWAGVSQDHRDLIDLSGRRRDGEDRGWRAAAGVEHGIDARTSAALQVHSLLLDDERLTYVEGAVRRSVGPALVEVSAAFEQDGGRAARALVLAEIGRTYVSAESTLAAGGFRSDRVEPGVTGRHIVSVDHAFTLGRTIVPAHAEARYVQREGGDALEAAARLSTSFRNWSLTAGVDWRRQGSDAGPDPPDIVEAGLLANGAIGPVRVRGEARWRLAPDARFDSAAVVAYWRASERADWRAELGYDHRLGRGRGAVGYVRRFDAFALNLSAEAATDGSVAAGLNLAFSLGPDPRGRGIRVTSNKLASRGTAVARVFRDLNQDGVRQPGEPLEPGVQVTAGPVPVARLTGRDGSVIVDELQPFRPVQIGIDTTSLSDPLLQPAKAALFVTPRPGIAMPVDIPLVGAGEVEGTLVKGGGGGFEGLDLELVDRDGRAVAATRTDFDGYFLFERVPYGRYAMRIAPAAAEALGLAAGLRDGLTVGSKAPSLRLGIVPASSR